MKLSDLNRVGEIEKDRAYLRTIDTLLLANSPVKVAGHDLRPDLAAAARQAIAKAIGDAARMAASDLRALGVEVDR